MAPRLSGQTSIFGVVFFVSKSLLGIEGQKKLEKFAIFTRKPRSHARILIYRTWPIGHSFASKFGYDPFFPHEAQTYKLALTNHLIYHFSRHLTALSSYNTVRNTIDYDIL